ncbi:hypothetical protein NDU88_006957 [Pleurodeles waltl]|uniref:Uncharacterized protein n=1 Tax=Pleurodeles waltl TaxID=8319 RepID=A0AAV7N2L2_PLEWA|nr:hypothetical protein NDU88_006957 [Pleurodeles waltl]
MLSGLLCEWSATVGILAVSLSYREADGATKQQPQPVSGEKEAEAHSENRPRSPGEKRSQPGRLSPSLPPFPRRALCWLTSALPRGHKNGTGLFK